MKYTRNHSLHVMWAQNYTLGAVTGSGRTTGCMLSASLIFVPHTGQQKFVSTL